jgi:hypothetical protein
MASRSYDVFVCSQGPSADALAHSLAEGLRGRGFRVFPSGGGQAGETAGNRPVTIEEVGDFVLVMGPGESAGSPPWDGRASDEVAEALRTRRNVVRLVAAGAEAAAREASGSVQGLGVTPKVIFDPSRPNESIALVAHHLSSDSTVDERRTGRRARRLFWAAALILLGGIALQEVPRFLARWSAPRLLAPVPPFALFWTGIGQRPGGGTWSEFPLNETTAVAPGDQLRIVFSTSADGFAYVVARASDGSVSMLFPTDAVRGASRVRAGDQHVAPVDEGWLDVGQQAPVDAIFIIAGYDAQQNLEELLEEPATGSNDAARRTLLDSTLAGLLDGRHGAAERRVWTGKLHPIDATLPFRVIDSRVSARLSSGATVQRGLAAQPGLASSCVELHFTRSASGSTAR